MREHVIGYEKTPKDGLRVQYCLAGYGGIDPRDAYPTDMGFLLLDIQSKQHADLRNNWQYGKTLHT